MNLSITNQRADIAETGLVNVHVLPQKMKYFWIWFLIKYKFICPRMLTLLTETSSITKFNFFIK